MVDHPGGPHDPRVRRAVGVTALLGQPPKFGGGHVGIPLTYGDQHTNGKVLKPLLPLGTLAPPLGLRLQRRSASFCLIDC